MGRNKMAETSFKDFLIGQLPADCSERPAIIGLPKGTKADHSLKEFELEVRLNVNGVREISRAYFEYSRHCSWEEGPVSSDEIRDLASGFAGGSSDIRIAGEVVNDNTTSMLRCERTGRDYLGSFDVSVYRGEYNSGNRHISEKQYCMKDMLEAVFEMLGISYRVTEESGLLTVTESQGKLKLAQENLSEAYQFLYDQGFMPVWIDGSLRDDQSDEDLRGFSVHNHFYRCGDGKPPLFSKTLSVEIGSGDMETSLTDDNFETLESALIRQGFDRKKFDYHYLPSPPMTVIE